MASLSKSLIKGCGHFLPDTVISNTDVVSRMNTTVDFILERTGVITRRHVKEHESLKDLIIPAFEMAISNAGITPADIDMLMVNTISPNHHDPSQACFMQPLLKLRNIPAFDIKAQCSGLIYGFDIADQYIKTGKHKNIAIICGEVLSKRMDCSDEGRNLSILLGDGAGVVILGENSSSSPKGFIDIITGADGNYFKLLWTESPGSWQTKYNNHQGSPDFRMTGKEMFEHASKTLVEISKTILNKNGLSISDIDLIIPHQPNMRILDKVIRDLKIPEDKMVINVDKFGNIASGSLPITLSVTSEKGNIPEGALCLFVGYGSGATWGAALYQN